MKFYVIGDVTVDHLYHLERIPAPGKEVTPARSTMQPGGSGGTISVTLARLGHSVTLAARVGDDPFADFALAEIKASGVGLGAIQIDPENLTSTITVMQTAGGGRAMISDGSANRLLDPAKLKKRDIETADALVVSAYSLTEGPQREYAQKAIEIAKSAKKPVPVFIDLGTGAVDKVGTQLLEDVKHADYLTLNQHELLALTGTRSLSAGLAKLSAAGVHRVAVKVGKRGSVVWTPEETELVDPVVPEGRVVDSTGAGDTFTAAFAHAVMEGKGLAQAARVANAAGALAATAVGAQRRAITPQDLAGVLGG
ncbi:ribokinase [Deinococcus reticulitermitis]|uniref:Ribokinase n=1 Tax=Deinococcus reticulitermitis TaxID=856736 RepID=A0A1H7AZQ5_9DEIO|nr:carbohydrate kinase family protein [Deinococcus reticulitermitis]SEJ67350.1 ribokinase [Deinococcus reticulitermitis]